MADIKKIIKDLGNTDWGKDNDAQMKAVQLLKGLATSEDPASNMFMKSLSDASTAIAKTILDHKPNDKNESVIERSTAILEGLEDLDAPERQAPKQVSSTISRASSLL